MLKIKENSYYLVALPRGEVLGWASRLQQEIAERYGIYEKPYPPVHLTLGILYPDNQADLDKAVALLNIILAKKKAFSIKVKGSSCFAPPFKSLNLSVESTPELESITREIYLRMKSNNIEANPMEDWDFHISLVNTIFARREWTVEEFYEACYLLEIMPLNLDCKITKLQLWSPRFPPLSVIATYRLI